MRCLSCKYDLSTLTERRCPECGREFDPMNPFTFETKHTLSIRRKQKILTIVVVSIIVVLVIYQLFIVVYFP